MLGDMPWVQGDTLQQLIAAYDDNHIVVPCYNGETGHPVIFPSACFGALEKLEGDRGGKAVITANQAIVKQVAVGDPNILKDIDTPADLARG